MSSDASSSPIHISSPVWFGNSIVIGVRTYYAAFVDPMTGLFRVGDFVLVQAPSATTLPYVARCLSFWEDEESKEMCVRLQWMYRSRDVACADPPDRKANEIYLSGECDDNSIHCIQSRAYVLTEKYPGKAKDGPFYFRYKYDISSRKLKRLGGGKEDEQKKLREPQMKIENESASERSEIEIKYPETEANKDLFNALLSASEDCLQVWNSWHEDAFRKSKNKNSEEEESSNAKIRNFCYTCGWSLKKFTERQAQCTHCQRAFHLFCLSTPQKSIRSSHWFCSDCNEARDLAEAAAREKKVADRLEKERKEKKEKLAKRSALESRRNEKKGKLLQRKSIKSLKASLDIQLSKMNKDASHCHCFDLISRTKLDEEAMRRASGNETNGIVKRLKMHNRFLLEKKHFFSAFRERLCTWYEIKEDEENGKKFDFLGFHAFDDMQNKICQFCEKYRKKKTEKMNNENNFDLLQTSPLLAKIMIPAKMKKMEKAALKKSIGSRKRKLRNY
eukprot:g2032.t1